MMQFSQNEWVTLTKTALKAWHQPLDLGEHPLAQLVIVQQRRTEMGYAADVLGQAQAVRDVLKQAIEATAPPGQLRPETAVSPQWLDPAWRTWGVLTLLYIRRMARGLVQAQIGMAEGGQYYRDQRRAVDTVASILQTWELATSPPQMALAYPGGAVRLDDPLYIPRQSDAALAQIWQQTGQTVTIRGARQVGKTSLLVRGVETAVQQTQSQAIYIDLQALSQADLANYDDFLRLLAEWLLDELGLDVGLATEMWGSRLGVARRLTKLIEQAVLPTVSHQLVLALDEVDRLIATPFGNDFFGLLRSWHNLRSRHPLWERLTILMAISTEPYLLIRDAQQSPFNVGQTLHLQDFALEQVALLNQQHGSPLTQEETVQLWQWTGGHPFLTRLSLYTVATEHLPWAIVEAASLTTSSPFADHLAHLWRILQTDRGLTDGLRTVAQDKVPLGETAVFRLLKAGLIRQTANGYSYRCELYRQYFAQLL